MGCPRSAALLLLALRLLPCFAADRAVVLTQYSSHSKMSLVSVFHARAALPPGVPLYLATHSYSDAAEGEVHEGHSPEQLAYLDALSVYVVPVAEEQTPHHASLRRNYRHMSGQGVLYERFCISRYASALYVAQKHDIDDVMMFDMDVATFMDLHGALGTGNWGFGSFISSWTVAGPTGLAAFAQFITDFYDGDGAHVAGNLKAHGLRVAPSDAAFHAKLTALSEDWWPQEAGGGGGDADGPDAAPRYMITDAELYDGFSRLANRTRVYCVSASDPAWRQARRRPGCFRGAGCTDWAAWWAPRQEKCWSEVGPAVGYTSRALDLDLVNASTGAYVGCRGALTAQETAALFEASFPGLGAEPEGAGAGAGAAGGGAGRGFASRPPRFGGVPVTAVHFDGACKQLLCGDAMCAPLHRAARTSPPLAASLAAGALGECCREDAAGHAAHHGGAAAAHHGGHGGGRRGGGGGGGAPAGGLAQPAAGAAAGARAEDEFDAEEGRRAAEAEAEAAAAAAAGGAAAAWVAAARAQPLELWRPEEPRLQRGQGATAAGGGAAAAPAARAGDGGHAARLESLRAKFAAAAAAVDAASAAVAQLREVER